MSSGALDGCHLEHLTGVHRLDSASLFPGPRFAFPDPASEAPATQTGVRVTRGLVHRCLTLSVPGDRSVIDHDAREGASSRPSELGGPQPPADRLSVRLLGPVDVRWRGEPLRFPGTATTALFALLVLRPGRHEREALAATLWPDAGATSSAWLRQALWQLRRAFGETADAVLDADPESIGIRPGVELDLDVAAFEAALRARPPRPELAVALYRGNLLGGTALECFARDRERLDDLYEDALAEVGLRCLDAGDLACAREAGARLIERDPLREEGHALLIEVYGHEGSRSQVSRQYRRLQQLLAHELGVEPLPETELSYRAALARTWSRSASRAFGRPLRGDGA